MPIIWFNRHGESQSNIGELTCSSKETLLTAVGHKQAQEIVQAFYSPYFREPSLIVTSEYRRSQQTAQPTQEAFPHALRQEWPVHEFTYLSEKKTLWTTRPERCQFVQQFWNNSDPDYSDGVEAESFTQFITRVYHVIESLRHSKQDFIAVFTHGQFIQAMLWILETHPLQMDGNSKAAFKHFCREHPIPTGAIQEIEFSGRENVRFGKLITDHLSVTNIYESCICAKTTSPECSIPAGQ